MAADNIPSDSQNYSTAWKHSSGDLQSRLKTRKILGVGETDNGDIHRSKISQVLGHNEHLYARLPRGLPTTHVLLASLVTVECALLLVSPHAAAALGVIAIPVEGTGCPLTPLRLLGAALSSLAVFLWTAVGTTDKHCARTALIATVLYNAMSVAIVLASAAIQGVSWRGGVTACVCARTCLCLLCLAYVRQIGEPGAGAAKSSSYRHRDSSCCSSPAPLTPQPSSSSSSSSSRTAHFFGGRSFSPTEGTISEGSSSDANTSEGKPRKGDINEESPSEGCRPLDTGSQLPLDIPLDGTSLSSLTSCSVFSSAAASVPHLEENKKIK
ncbi:tumor protein p53-inducible protein 11-like [Hyalella azteca]|uniref:Tumor protein p53-inducible protein 11 n=1 Tax=Hyalella azteca TaxID=294128 RepID=A0A979FNB2_HYAAZ|nr:tumor protein p53-inducible protein 11-like [Hyalella azteca]